MHFFKKVHNKLIDLFKHIHINAFILDFYLSLLLAN